MLAVTDQNGNAITDTTHIAHINPFRYRGYYYDVESGFYYLQSRYYDPEMGRFLNADEAEAIAEKNLGSAGYNLYTYCQNEPVKGCDIDGRAFVQIFAKIVLGIMLGIFSQLMIDILDYLVRSISNPKAQFSAKPKDYVLSILSSILAFFDIRNRFVRIAIAAGQIVLSHIGSGFSKQMWANLAVDLVFLIVGEILGGILNRSQTKQIQKAKDTIAKNKTKVSRVVRNSTKKKKVEIQQKFYALGVGINFALNISSALINNIINIFIK